MPDLGERPEPAIAPAPVQAPGAVPAVLPGLGLAAGPGLLTHLARSPVGRRAAAIDQLQTTVGNRRVTGLLTASGLLQREPVDHPTPLETERVEAPNGRHLRISEWGTDPHEKLQAGQKPTRTEVYWVDFELDDKGTMRASARTVDAKGKFRSRTLRLGEQFNLAVAHFKLKGKAEVQRFEGDWSWMSPTEMSVNLRKYREAIKDGASKEDAARQTPSGRIAAAAGFSEVKVLSDKSEVNPDIGDGKKYQRVRAEFTRPAGGGKPPVAPAKTPPPTPDKPPTTTKTSTRVKGGIALAVMGGSILLNRIIESGNEDRIRAALKAREADMLKAQQDDPTLGFLLVFRYEGASTGLEGSSASGRFTRFSYRRGYTQAEAQAIWNGEARFQEKGVEYEFGWVPPLEAPDPALLSTPFAKVAVGRFADIGNIVFQRAQFKEWGGLDTKGTDGPHDGRKWRNVFEALRFVVLRMPAEIPYFNVNRRLERKSVESRDVAVLGGKVPAVLLDGTPAVTVWAADAPTEEFFRRFSKPISDKEGKLAPITNINLVRWLPPDQVRLVDASGGGP